MRTKIITTIVVLVLIGLIGIVAYLYSKDNMDNNDTGITYDEKDYYTNIVGSVNNMIFADDYRVEGIVTCKKDKDCIENIELNKEDIIEENAYMGKEYSYDEYLYKKDGKQVLAKGNLRLLEIQKEDENQRKLCYLNYDNLCVETEVDYENYKKIHENVKVQVFFDGETYEGKIEYIDYLINNNRVKILIDTDARYLPGAEVEVRFIYEEEKEYLCISSEFVIKQGENTYVQINVGTNHEIVLEDKKVILGKTLEMTDEYKTYVYYEVLEGLKESDEIWIKVRAGEKIE